MKKGLKVLLSIISVIVIFGIQMGALAADTATGIDINRVYQLLQAHGENQSIDDQVLLYDSNEQVIASGYSLSPHGYVILDLAGNPIEYSFNNDCPFSLTEKTYYTGPLEYHEKEADGSYRNLTTFETSTQSSLDERSSAFRQAAAVDSMVSIRSTAATSSYYTYTLPHATHTYSYNPDSRCGSVAAAIWLMYYDECLDDNTVPSNLVSSDGVTLINFLVPHIEGDPHSGSTTAELAAGLNWYFQWRNLDQWFTADITKNASMSDYIAGIDWDVPTIVDLNSHFAYGEHWVVGYGYSYSSSSEEIIVNDGWGRTGVYISMHYVGDTVN